MKTVMRLAIIAAGFALGSILGPIRRARIGRRAIINLGMGDARLDCRHRTVEEYVSNLIAGDHGCCGPSRYGPAAAAVPVKRTYKHHVRQEQPAIVHVKAAYSASCWPNRTNVVGHGLPDLSEKTCAGISQIAPDSIGL